MLLEEQGPKGTSDSAPMTLYQLYIMLEKRGIVNFKLTSHDCERPAEVQKGNVAYTLEVSHTSHSVYKPNPVQQKHVKASNLGGFLNYNTLEKSKYLELVWRNLDHIYQFSIVSFVFDIPLYPSQGMRHYGKEKVLGPAKPLWFIKGDGFHMEANKVYEVA